MAQSFRLPCPFCDHHQAFEPTEWTAREALHRHIESCHPPRSPLVELVAAARELVSCHDESFGRVISKPEYTHRVFSPRVGSQSANVGRLAAALESFDHVEV